VRNFHLFFCARYNQFISYPPEFELNAPDQLSHSQIISIAFKEMDVLRKAVNPNQETSTEVKGELNKEKEQKEVVHGERQLEKVKDEMSSFLDTLKIGIRKFAKL
jgi:hypothetical protein